MASFLQPPNSHLLSDSIIGEVMQHMKPRHRKILSEAAQEASITASRMELRALSATGKKLSHRERCRINQARYRKKQRNAMAELERSVEELRAEIRTLKDQKMAMLSRKPREATVWNVAVEYFRMFKHGYVVPMAMDGNTTHQQLEFLQHTVVTDGDAKEIVEHWRFLSTRFQDVHLHLQRLKQGPRGSLVASTTTSVTISANTLRRVFPHLQAEGAAEWLELGQKLLGRRVVMKGSVRFDWDSVQGRVVRLESSTDMLTPMLQIVGSLEDVARVFKGACITPECRQRQEVYMF